MTIDLAEMKRLAADLAGDVLNQIEKDGSINRENIAAQLLAGLVLDAARKINHPKSNAVPTRLRENWGVDDQKLRELTLPVLYAMRNRVAPAGSPVHIVCECDECRRRRSHSLCGCEMCDHHTSAKAQIDADEHCRKTAVYEQPAPWPVPAPIGGLQAMLNKPNPHTLPPLWQRDAAGHRFLMLSTSEKLESLRLAIRHAKPALFAGEPHIFVMPCGEVVTRTELQRKAFVLDLHVPDSGPCYTGLEIMKMTPEKRKELGL